MQVPTPSEPPLSFSPKSGKCCGAFIPNIDMSLTMRSLNAVGVGNHQKSSGPVSPPCPQLDPQGAALQVGRAVGAAGRDALLQAAPDTRNPLVAASRLWEWAKL